MLQVQPTKSWPYVKPYMWLVTWSLLSFYSPLDANMCSVTNTPLVRFKNQIYIKEIKFKNQTNKKSNQQYHLLEMFWNLIDHFYVLPKTFFSSTMLKHDIFLFKRYECSFTGVTVMFVLNQTKEKKIHLEVVIQQNAI